jgi:hypothetical protein
VLCVNVHSIPGMRLNSNCRKIEKIMAESRNNRKKDLIHAFTEHGLRYNRKNLMTKLYIRGCIYIRWRTPGFWFERDWNHKTYIDVKDVAIHIAKRKFLYDYCNFSEELERISQTIDMLMTEKEVMTINLDFDVAASIALCKYWIRKKGLPEDSWMNEWREKFTYPSYALACLAPLDESMWPAEWPWVTDQKNKIVEYFRTFVGPEIDSSPPCKFFPNGGYFFSLSNDHYGAAYKKALEDKNKKNE